MVSALKGIDTERKFSYGSSLAVEGSGGSRGHASSMASIAYPEGLLLVVAASRQADTSHREAQQLGLAEPLPLTCWLSVRCISWCP